MKMGFYFYQVFLRATKKPSLILNWLIASCKTYFNDLCVLFLSVCKKGVHAFCRSHGNEKQTFPSKSRNVHSKAGIPFAKDRKLKAE